MQPMCNVPLSKGSYIVPFEWSFNGSMNSEGEEKKKCHIIFTWIKFEKKEK